VTDDHSEDSGRLIVEAILDIEDSDSDDESFYSAAISEPEQDDDHWIGPDFYREDPAFQLQSDSDEDVYSIDYDGNIINKEVEVQHEDEETPNDAMKTSGVARGSGRDDVEQDSISDEVIEIKSSSDLSTDMKPKAVVEGRRTDDVEQDSISEEVVEVDSCTEGEDDDKKASSSDEQLFTSGEDSPDVQYIKTVTHPNVECLEDLPELTGISAAEQQMNLIDHGWWEVLTTEPSSLGIDEVPIDEDARLQAITHFRLEELYGEAEYNAPERQGN
jgi:hypothetical protein